MAPSAPSAFALRWHFPTRDLRPLPSLSHPFAPAPLRRCVFAPRPQFLPPPALSASARNRSFIRRPLSSLCPCSRAHQTLFAPSPVSARRLRARTPAHPCPLFGPSCWSHAPSCLSHRCAPRPVLAPRCAVAAFPLSALPRRRAPRASIKPLTRP
ncbi:hypothetical protein DENSPDRAFT_887174 [Dentipellis sp. KUC8613]|nr:hypothetical protein DENSPDRAFT_887174 [Dentipellis sp. KUC8613]